MSLEKKIYLTQEGYDEIKEELNYLINTKRPENIIAIKEARALGDLSENADYDAARNEQAEIEARIKKLEAIVDNVEIIEEVSTEAVGLGNTVKIAYVDDEEDLDEYKIVGSQEADPFESKISNESPIAKVIMGKKVNDIVSVESPTGNYQVQIISIK